MDDLVFDPSYVNLVLSSLDQDTSKPETWNQGFGWIGRIGATLRLCDAAVATNCYLAEKIRQFSGKETKVINLQSIIGSTEINIAPLQDNPFTNCKSELKF